MQIVATPTDRAALVRILPAFDRFRAVIEGLWPRMMRKEDPSACTRVACLGAQHGDGTTTIAACAAIGMAENLRAEVLLLEANLRTPCLAGRMGLAAPPGLRDVLAGTTSVRQAVQRTEIPGLSVLTAGAEDPSVRALEVDRLARLFSDLEEVYRFVVVDGPPLPLYPDGRALLWHVDAALPVVCAGRTPKAAARSVLRELDEAGIPVNCSVLNRFSAGVVQFIEPPGR